MNQDVLKWVGAVLAGAAWFALVIMGKADAGTFIQFLQFSILGLGVHAMSSPGATRMTAPAPAPTEPAKNAQGGWTRLLNLCMLALAAIVVALLFGCAGPIVNSNTPLGKFTLQDAQGASALAKQRGDVAGQKCYDYIAESLAAAAAVPFTPGLLYLNELRRTAAEATNGLAAACGGVLPITVGL